jgi:hypothetical protein
MANKKYAKYLLNLSSIKIQNAPSLEFKYDNPDGSEFNFCLSYVKEPFFYKEPAHNHPYDVYESYIGGNPSDIVKLNSELEISLGPEQEKHQIKNSSSLFVPQELVHSDVAVNKIKDPFWILTVFNAMETSSKKTNKKKKLLIKKLPG